MPNTTQRKSFRLLREGQSRPNNIALGVVALFQRLLCLIIIEAKSSTLKRVGRFVMNAMHRLIFPGTNRVDFE